MWVHTWFRRTNNSARQIQVWFHYHLSRYLRSLWMQHGSAMLLPGFDDKLSSRDQKKTQPTELGSSPTVRSDYSSYNNNEIIMLQHRRRVSGTYIASLYAPSPRTRHERLYDVENSIRKASGADPTAFALPNTLDHDGPWTYAEVEAHKTSYDDVEFVSHLYADATQLRLLRRFPNLVNLRDRDGVVLGGGETLLHRAVRSRNQEAVDALLRKRAHPWVGFHCITVVEFLVFTYFVLVIDARLSTMLEDLHFILLAAWVTRGLPLSMPC